MITNYTILNPNLTVESAQGDHKYIFNGKGTPAENLIEFAGRVCYRSTERMGHSANFNQQRVAEGHTDLLEHAYASALVPEISPLVDYLEGGVKTWTDPRRYVVIDNVPYMNDQMLVTTNLRTWLNIIQWTGIDTKTFPRLFDLAPSLFTVYPNGEPVYTEPPSPALETPYFIADPIPSDPRMASQRVSLLARSNFLACGEMQNHYAVTFLIEGVSRSLTHQLVRHRLSSISQESQRYVDADKGQWKFVVPPSFQMEYADQQEFLDGQQASLTKYYKFRRKGYLKEDARYMLTNAIETRLVVSGPLPAWRHLFSQRMDKAAQWEIRNAAYKMCKLLVSNGLDCFSSYCV